MATVIGRDVVRRGRFWAAGMREEEDPVLLL
jgi:hypothetical protein